MSVERHVEARAPGSVRQTLEYAAALLALPILAGVAAAVISVVALVVERVAG